MHANATGTEYVVCYTFFKQLVHYHLKEIIEWLLKIKPDFRVTTKNANFLQFPTQQTSTCLNTKKPPKHSLCSFQQ